MIMKYTQQFIVNDEQEMQSLAVQCSEVWASQQFLCLLRGDLGAGKTTFVRHYLKSIGVVGHIKSPTYALIEPYQVQGVALHHIDLYRLEDPEDIIALDLPQIFAESSCFVEWSERLHFMGVHPDILINIEHQGAKTRLLTINANSDLLLLP